MPASARTRMRVWKNSRVVNSGSATHGVGERAVEISSDDIDISDTSNSANRNCRQNISDGWRTVAVRSRPSALTAPSISGRVLGLSESAMLKESRWRDILFLYLRFESGMGFRSTCAMRRVGKGALFAPRRRAHGKSGKLRFAHSTMLLR